MGDLKKAEWLVEKLNLEDAQVVYRVARQNQVPCVRIGRRIRFDEDVIEAFIENGGKGLRAGSETTDAD